MTLGGTTCFNCYPYHGFTSSATRVKNVTLNLKMLRNILCKVINQFLFIPFCGEEENYSCFSFALLHHSFCHFIFIWNIVLSPFYLALTWIVAQYFHIKYNSHEFDQEHKVNNKFRNACNKPTPMKWTTLLCDVFLCFASLICCYTYVPTLVELLMCRLKEWMK